MNDFVESLRTLLPMRSRRIIERDQRAAVLVPIVDDGGPLRLLMTRRTTGLPTHQGQVAFPGGSMMIGERDPAVTALRESCEEIALPPDSVEILGLLDDFVTHTGRIAVTPVVGRIRKLPDLVAAPFEVARIFTIPVEELVQVGRWSAQEKGWFFEHDGETLWGLSARIVVHLLEIGGLDYPAAP
jgi:8-oxo-dGTP pyrophosphatase MutT (NUDIX family)